MKRSIWMFIAVAVLMVLSSFILFLTPRFGYQWENMFAKSDLVARNFKPFFTYSGTQYTEDGMRIDYYHSWDEEIRVTQSKGELRIDMDIFVREYGVERTSERIHYLAYPNPNMPSRWVILIPGEPTAIASRAEDVNAFFLLGRMRLHDRQAVLWLRLMVFYGLWLGCAWFGWLHYKHNAGSAISAYRVFAIILAALALCMALRVILPRSTEYWIPNWFPHISTQII